MRGPAPVRPRGFTLAELLVGLAVGGLVLAAAVWAVGTHLALQRRQMIALQIDQELRAAAELMTRSLRRAGFWWGADSAAPAANPYAGWSVSAGPDPGSSAVRMAHAHPERAEDGARTRDEEQGFRVRLGVLESKLGEGNWQALTDPRLMRITRLDLAPRLEPACPAGLVVRSLLITLQAQAVADAAVRRQWSSTVRLRNDMTGAACPLPDTP